MSDATKNPVDRRVDPLELVKRQRSHILCVFANPSTGQKNAFLEWFGSDAMEAVVTHDLVMSGQHFERKDYDITNGVTIPCKYDYLGFYELHLDGAHEAEPLLRAIFDLYNANEFATKPASWLYYPVSEKSGRAPAPGMHAFMSLAFASAVAGNERVFREWYTTEHIRHALNIPTYVGSQRFELTCFQNAGSANPAYDSMTVYEQEGTIEDIIDGINAAQIKYGDDYVFCTASREVMDHDRFAEWVYYPLT